MGKLLGFDRSEVEIDESVAPVEKIPDGDGEWRVLAEGQEKNYEPVRLWLNFFQELTPGRLDIFDAVREKPQALSSLARELQRNMTAVRRDAEVLLKLKLVTIQTGRNPGQGRSTIIKAAYDPGSRLALTVII